MDTRTLSYIIAIAEEKSISKAAERLYMAQSSLSQYLTIDDLGDVSGISLICKASSGSQINGSGKALP